MLVVWVKGKIVAKTLAQSMADDRVDFVELQKRYEPVLNLVNVLIGVVPYCDRYLEIWPPGFRSYNLMVPNFLNLPNSLVGLGAPKDLVGLAIYTSSRAANCAYCSAHTCTYALRRGADVDSVTGAARTPTEQAVTAVAEALSSDPHHFTPELDQELRRRLSDDDAEWVVMGVAMMGFLNKFMDAMGIDLEPDTVNEVIDLIEPTGWSVGQHGWADTESDRDQASGLPPRDSLRTMAKVARNGPGAAKLEKQWMADVPKDPQQAQAMIVNRFGFDASLLAQMRHAKPRRALAAMLRHNLDPEQSELGIGLKALVGLSFAKYMGNDFLVEAAKSLARLHDVDEPTIAATTGFLFGTTSSDQLDQRTVAVLNLTQVMAPSPAIVSDESIQLAKSVLTSAEIIEIAVWVSVNQLMHRLSVYYQTENTSAADNSTKAS